MSTILVIEGEPVAGLLREFLTIKGFTVVTAGDPERAIEALQRRSPDAVVVDPFHLGQAQGEFLRHIRLRANLRPLPLVLLKSTWPPPSAYRAVASVASAVLPQPLRLSRLAITLDSCLAGDQGHGYGDGRQAPVAAHHG
ncbi:MAG: response regulator [Bacillota bacterium]|nr:response regulator [Bacillota bacterium]